MNLNLAVTTPGNPLADVEWVDSHVHFDLFDREGVLDQVVQRARSAGVCHMVAIGGSDEANERAVRVSGNYPGVIRCVVGFDRDKATDGVNVSGLREMIGTHADCIAGIGESGLDYHYEPETAGAQKKLFEHMLEIAASTRLPIVVHSRDADQDTLELLTAFVRNWPGDPACPGVLHCFTGTYEFARKLLDIGIMISFSGIVTFRNAGDLRACAGKLPLDRILIETDAPYLAPMPHRGKTNEPGWVPRVAETLASIRSDTLQDIARQTTENARALFQLTKDSTT